MRKKQAKTIIGVILAATCCLYLTACFDFENEITVTSVGSGKISLTIKLPPQMAEMMKLARKQKGKGGGMSPNIISPRSKTTFKKTNKGYYIIETAHFGTIAEIKAKPATYELAIVSRGASPIESLLGRGVIPLRALTYRLTVVVRPRKSVPTGRPKAKPKKLSPEQKKQVEQMVKSMFAKRTFTVKMNLPSPRIEAATVTMGNLVIHPKLSSDKRTVTWKIPLLKLMGKEAVKLIKKPVRFWATFKARIPMSSKEMKSGMVKASPAPAKPAKPAKPVKPEKRTKPK